MCCFHQTINAVERKQMSQPFPYRSAFSLGLYPTLPPQPLLCVISVYHFHTLPPLFCYSYPLVSLDGM